MCDFSHHPYKSWSRFCSTIDPSIPIHIYIYSLNFINFQKAVTDALSMIVQFIVFEYLRANPVNGGQMKMKTMVVKGRDKRNSDTEVWWPDPVYKLKDGVPFLIRRWLVEGRKQINLSFNSILLSLLFTNHPFLLWCICQLLSGH